MNDKLRVPMYETDSVYKRIAEGSLTPYEFFVVINDLVERTVEAAKKAEDNGKK